MEDLDAQPAETVEAIALEVLGKLLRLARYQDEERQRSVSRKCLHLSFPIDFDCIFKKKKERPIDVLANIDQQRADLLPNQVNVNYLLKQPVFRSAEDILKNYQRPINLRFESGEFSIRLNHRCYRSSFRFDCTTYSSTISHCALIIN